MASFDRGSRVPKIDLAFLNPPPRVLVTKILNDPSPCQHSLPAKSRPLGEQGKNMHPTKSVKRLKITPNLWTKSKMKLRPKSAVPKAKFDILQVENWSSELNSLLTLLDQHCRGCGELRRLTKTNKVLASFRIAAK
jgi:hypothetical protein